MSPADPTPSGMPLLVVQVPASGAVAVVRERLSYLRPIRALQR
jgi:hypothetical protein